MKRLPRKYITFAAICAAAVLASFSGCSPAFNAGAPSGTGSNTAEPSTSESSPNELSSDESNNNEPDANEPNAVTSPLAFAKKTLAESYTARAELGEIESVTVKRNEGVGHAFAVKASKHDATMTLISITPSGEPSGTLFLDDGRQIPLFIPVLEESYKSDLGL
jgi:hypothetical protein